jgi:hypothetical protein
MNTVGSYERDLRRNARASLTHEAFIVAANVTKEPEEAGHRSTVVG